MDAFLEAPAARLAWIFGRQDALGRSFKQRLRQHRLVFVIEDMTVKDRHAPDYRVGEVHNLGRPKRRLEHAGV
jgi:hypothetical protein